ncbi:homeobox protein ANF-1 [Planoprotostelium fungivorum]|uniref:Homeobox protein ANF-1 n=1 Tax=Planoprotostelium fungivorum TaxID=1890364 RepID=A0A2P6NMI7_9EUKA|nr:homeobox protein ANF-1 [Planoprotostelium fungivorum]
MRHVKSRKHVSTDGKIRQYRRSLSQLMSFHIRQTLLSVVIALYSLPTLFAPSTKRRKMLLVVSKLLDEAEPTPTRPVVSNTTEEHPLLTSHTYTHELLDDVPRVGKWNSPHLRKIYHVPIIEALAASMKNHSNQYGRYASDALVLKLCSSYTENDSQTTTDAHTQQTTMPKMKVPFLVSREERNNLCTPDCTIHLGCKKFFFYSVDGDGWKMKDLKKQPCYQSPRRTFSLHQQLELLDLFQKNQYPSREEKEALAKRFNVDERKIQIWFQNKRARSGRVQTEIGNALVSPFDERGQARPSISRHHRLDWNKSINKQAVPLPANNEASR